MIASEAITTTTGPSSSSKKSENRENGRTTIGLGFLLVCVLMALTMDTHSITTVLQQQQKAIAASVVNGQQQQQQQQKSPRREENAALVSWNDNLNSKEDDKEKDACVVAMRYIRHVNECFQSPSCVSPKAPLFHWAFYEGQGFGRLVEQSALTCLIAASMGRPCVVDMTPRDPYHTFQSFVTSRLQMGPSDYTEWFSEEQQDEIHRAHALLKKPSLGHWTEKDIQDSNQTFHHVLLLQEEWSDDEIRDKIESNPTKIVLLPNWGTAWISGQVKLNNFLEVYGHVAKENGDDSAPSCNARMDQVQTLMENYMYTPTDLAYALHTDHVRRMFQIPPEMEVNPDNGRLRPVRSPLERALLPQERWNLLPLPKYGAIHIRFHILRRTTSLFPEVDLVVVPSALVEFASKLRECLESFSQVTQNVSQWWILADDLELARNVTTLLQEGSEHGDDGDRPNFFLEDETTTASLPSNKDQAADTASLRTDNGGVQHSNAGSARGIMGHSYMAVSFLDWMVLQEAQVAVVSTGAFGATGGRGRSKRLVNSCDIFQLFAAPSESNWVTFLVSVVLAACIDLVETRLDRLLPPLLKEGVLILPLCRKQGDFESAQKHILFVGLHFGIYIYIYIYMVGNIGAQLAKNDCPRRRICNATVENRTFARIAPSSVLPTNTTDLPMVIRS